MTTAAFLAWFGWCKDEQSVWVRIVANTWLPCQAKPQQRDCLCATTLYAVSAVLLLQQEQHQLRPRMATHQEWSTSVHSDEYRCDRTMTSKMVLVLLGMTDIRKRSKYSVSFLITQKQSRYQQNRTRRLAAHFHKVHL